VFRIRSLVVALFVLCSIISAQEFRATLGGHVTDPSGAVVPNATITAVNNDTKLSYTAASTASGSYQIPYMLPGTYTVSTTAQSFKTTIRSGVVLNGGESSTLDVGLTMGATQLRVAHKNSYAVGGVPPVRSVPEGGACFSSMTHSFPR
jgi:Carboxypeptidase regulatory-like domain